MLASCSSILPELLWGLPIHSRLAHQLLCTSSRKGSAVVSTERYVIRGRNARVCEASSVSCTIRFAITSVPYARASCSSIATCIDLMDMNVLMYAYRLCNRKALD